MLRIVRPDEVPVEEYHISTGRLCKKNSSLLAAINKIPLICSSKCPFFKKRSQNAIDSRLSLNEHLYNQPSDVHANSYPDLDTRGRGGDWMELLPGVFDMFQNFEMILPLRESL